MSCGGKKLTARRNIKWFFVILLSVYQLAGPRLLSNPFAGHLKLSSFPLFSAHFQFTPAMANSISVDAPLIRIHITHRETVPIDVCNSKRHTATVVVTYTLRSASKLVSNCWMSTRQPAILSFTRARVYKSTYVDTFGVCSCERDAYQIAALPLNQLWI